MRLSEGAAWAMALTAGANAQNSSFAQQCSSLDLSSVLPNATVWFSDFVAGGTNITFPDNDPR